MCNFAPAISRRPSLPLLAVFVIIFILGCIWVVLQSIRIYRVTYDIRLRRLFWVSLSEGALFSACC